MSLSAGNLSTEILSVHGSVSYFIISMDGLLKKPSNHRHRGLRGLGTAGLEPLLETVCWKV